MFPRLLFKSIPVAGPDQCLARGFADSGLVRISKRQPGAGLQKLINRRDLFRIAFRHGDNRHHVSDGEDFPDEPQLARPLDIRAIGGQVEICLARYLHLAEQGVGPPILDIDADPGFLFKRLSDRFDGESHAGGAEENERTAVAVVRRRLWFGSE